MPLRRVDTTFDLLEAHIVVVLLRSEGIDAYLFDADFVRQDWFKALAYGGYRILVPDADVPAACECVHAYRKTKVSLSVVDDTPCPSCGTSSYRDDPRPRRWVFAIYMAHQVVVAILLVRAGSQQGAIVLAFAIGAADIVLALIAIRYLKRRFVCDHCGHRWRDRIRYSHPTLPAASTTDSDASQ